LMCMLRHCFKQIIIELKFEYIESTLQIMDSMFEAIISIGRLTVLFFS
jgi:hypothetical protein